ncbi:uncharacterized protein CC84DRAFT_1163084 [Paraphaeosphaeria sporulosa]|uniref:Uncharacterized protein n=1 Tax=Paraphaeosphaeria sporulosa TaxID=1460663 RepID=A0A177CIU4_9PLEO|nr:uncharacterized protein CC84DRAFT_1163084 [Paraphaeosphaeria sporulosa]OAG06778.1 hypothetical protein CC84DRAFT_1163084 [Paraphaeosphaeria sporulosa]
MSVSNSDNLLTEQDQSLIRAGIDFLKEYFADQGEGAKEVGKTKKEQVNQTKRTNPDNAATRSAQDSPRLSKTAIGRRIFELQDLPQLCVITVEVHQVAGKDGTGEVEPGWNRVYNTSLKEKAIGELLRNDFPRIYHTAIVIIQQHQKPVGEV